MKTSGARAKGRGQSAGPANGPSARAATAYASASPLDFQEPWRDEPEPSSQNRHTVNVNLQQKQRQDVAPVVLGSDLPEDWEEAASAVGSSDSGLEEAVLAPAEAAPAEAAPAKAAPEAAASVVDEASVDERSVDSAPGRGSDSSVTDGKDALSVDALFALGNQAEAAAAASSATQDTNQAKAEAAAARAAARSHANKGSAEAVSPVDVSQEGAPATDFADERQETLAVAAKESAGVEDAALPSACEGMLQSMLVLSEPRPASEASAASNSMPENSPDYLAVSDFSAASGKEEVRASAANECHGGHSYPQGNGDVILLARGEEHQSECCTDHQDSAAEAELDDLIISAKSSFSLSAEASHNRCG